MNHSGDTNKMVGETPRTDAECGDYDRSGCWKSYINGECVQSDFARQLERELNAATSEIERLRKANFQLREGAEKQKQRIKRLEEAGDAMDKTAEPFVLDTIDEDSDDGPIPMSDVGEQYEITYDSPPTAGDHVAMDRARKQWRKAKEAKL